MIRTTDELHIADDMAAAVKTYRYLRIGLVLAVVVLLAAVLREEWDNPRKCFQTSLSAYYYTPVRTVFVAALFVISFGLIAIKGRGLEDMALNLAGVLAPLVAVIPTTDVGNCWREKPNPFPLVSEDPEVPKMFAPWLRDNITNNMTALAFGAAVALLLAGIVIVLEKRYPGPEYMRVSRQDILTYAAMLIIVLVILSYVWWHYDSFLDNAHGPSAYTMFGFLGLAIATNAYHDRKTQKSYAVTYGSIALAMLMTVIVLVGFFRDWNHMVLWLEILEISFFALFWAVQTFQHWRDVGLDNRAGSPIIPAPASDAGPA